jgi:putative endonuclease
MFHVYIIESESSGKWYYGYTQRIHERISDHNTNHSHHTGGKGPWKLIFQRSFEDQSEALQFEKKLKSLRNKAYLQREYAEYFLKI